MNCIDNNGPSAQAQESAQTEGESRCEVTASPKLATKGSGKAVSPAISLAISPANGREKLTTETKGNQPSNQSGGQSLNKPNCYECKHRRELLGDCHSSCGHPAASPLALVMFLSGQTEFNLSGLHVRGSTHGIRSGWFNWPLNFDPVWLEICSGFTKDA